MNPSLIVAYENGGRVICPDCLGMFRHSDPAAHANDTVPLFAAEIRPNDRCCVCCRWIAKEPIDA